MNFPENFKFTYSIYVEGEFRRFSKIFLKGVRKWI